MSNMTRDKEHEALCEEYSKIGDALATARDKVGIEPTEVVRTMR